MARTTPTPETEYIVGLNNNPRGPFNREDLILMARGGLLNEKTRIFVKGWEKWKTIAEVEELSRLVADNPPAPSTGPSPGGHLPEGWDRELRSALAKLQQQIEDLAEHPKNPRDGDLGVVRELVIQLDQFQENTATRLAEVQAKSGKDITVLLAAMEEAFSSKIKSLETEQKAILRQLQEDQAARQATLETNQQAFDRLQKALALEKEKELLAFADRVENMDQRFSAIQQAFFLSAEQLKKEMSLSLTAFVEQAKDAQKDILDAHAQRHEVVVAKQAEAGLVVQKLQTDLEQKLEKLADEGRQSGRETTALWTELQGRLARWDQEFPKQIEAVTAEVQNTPGRVEALLAKLEQERKVESVGTTARLDKLEELLEGQMKGVRALLTDHAAQAGLNLQSGMETFEGKFKSLQDRFKEFEDVTLERHSMLLAAADDQKSIPERINRQMQDWSAEVKARLEGFQTAMDATGTTIQQTRQTVDELREAGKNQVATLETRLVDLSRVQAERLSEELASVHQEHMRRLQTSDEERQQHFMALSQAFNGMVTHLDEDLPARLTRMENQLQEGLKKTASAMDGLAQLETNLKGTMSELSRSQTELAAKTSEIWKEQQSKFDQLGTSLQEEIHSGQLAQQEESVRLHELTQQGLKDSAEQGRRLYEEQAKERGLALQKMEAELLLRLSGELETIQELGKQQQAMRDATLQSLSNLGGWTQSLHEKIEKNAQAQESLVSSLKLEIQGQMAGGQEAMEEKLLAFDQSGRATQAESQRVVAGLATSVSSLEKQLRDTAKAWEERLEVHGQARSEDKADLEQALNQIGKSLEDNHAHFLSTVQKQSEARDESMAELSAVLVQMVERLTRTETELTQKIETEGKLQMQQGASLAATLAELQAKQGVMEKNLAEEWNVALSKRWNTISTELAQIKQEAAERERVLRQNLAELEGKIPGYLTEQIAGQTKNLQSGFGLVSQALEKQNQQMQQTRQELEKEMVLQLGKQQRSMDELLKMVREDLTQSMAAKWDAVSKDLAKLKMDAPALSKTMVEELHKAIGRMPDYLTESYRVTNNAMQKQLAEMAQEVNSATQQIEKSRATLEKAGSTHLENLQEAAESARQDVANVFRDAKEERQKLYGQLFQELKNWQMEQKKILAAVLKSEKTTG